MSRLGTLGLLGAPVGLSYLVRTRLEEFVLDQVAVRLRAQAKPLIDRRLEHLDGQVPLTELAAILALDLTNRDTTATVIDRRLRTLASGPPEDGPAPVVLDEALYRAVLTGDPHVTVVSRHPNGRRSLTLLIPPIAWQPQPPAVVQLSVYVDQQDGLLRRLGWAIWAVTTGAVAAALPGPGWGRLVLGLTGVTAGWLVGTRDGLARATDHKDFSRPVRAGSSLEGEREVIRSSFAEMMRKVEAAFLAQRINEERMRRFVADASHELRTPLTALIGALDLLARGQLSPEDGHRMETVLRNQVERIARLVEDLLTLTRLEAGMELEIGSLDLVELALEHAAELRLGFPDRSVVVEADRPVLVPGDAMRLWQVLANLTTNAMRHTDEGGTITIRVEERGEEAILSVSDDGEGIAEEDLPRVFERFFRADRARSNGGTGLGLAIVRTIVTAHGGQVEVQSRLHHGTTFEVRLPMVAIAR